MYEMCNAWERNSGRTIYRVLQTGDLGIFASEHDLDRATRKHAKRDSTELGAIPYVTGSKIPTHKTIFVAGNHEDFNFLRKHENQTIDPSGRLYYLASSVVEVNSEDEHVYVAGYSGIHPQTPNENRAEAGRGFRHHDLEASELLMKHDAKTDILLTHDGPACEELERTHGKGAGSPVVRKLIEKLQPRFAVFGHYGRPPEPFMISNTLVVPMNNSRALTVPKRHGGMGILDTDSWKFSFVL